MKQLRKAVLIIMTAVMMMLVLTPYGSVLAQDGEEEGPVLFVGGIEVTDANKDDILNDGGKAKFDPDTGILTLNEPVFGSDLECPILASGMDLTIEGDVSAVGKTFGIYVDEGVLTFTGGSVYAKGATAIVAKALVIDGGNVTAVNVPSGSASKTAVFANNTVDVISGELGVTATGDKCIALAAGGDITVTGGKVTVNTNGRDDCYGIKSNRSVIIGGGEVNATVNAEYLNFPSYEACGIYAGDTVSISGGTVNVVATSGYNARGIMGNIQISGGDVTVRANGTYGYGICSDVWGSWRFSMSDGKADIYANGSDHGDAISLEGNLTVSGGVLIAAGEGGKLGSTGIDVTGNITISGGKVTASGKSTTSSGITCYTYGASGQVKLEISGGEVSATGTGEKSDGIFCNQDLVISGGTVYAKGTETGIHGEGGIKVGNGIVSVTCEGDDAAISTVSDSGYYNKKISLGSEVAIRKPDGGVLSADGKTINTSAGRTATYAELANPYEYAINVSEAENGKVTSERTKANAGEKITLTVTPNDSCVLTSISVKDLSGTDVPVSDSYEFTMPESDVTVSAVFTRYYALTIPEESQAFISIGVTQAAAGEKVNVVFKDVEGHVIKEITVTDSEGNTIDVDEDNSFVMPASEVTVTAVTAALYTVTFELNGGTLNGDPGPITLVLEEGSVIVLGKPVREGYTFKYWEGSVYYAGDEYEVTEDHGLEAVWEKIQVPNTGDSDRLILYLWLLAVSAAGAAAVMIHRRKAGGI